MHVQESVLGAWPLPPEDRQRHHEDFATRVLALLRDLAHDFSDQIEFIAAFPALASLEKGTQTLGAQEQEQAPASGDVFTPQVSLCQADGKTLKRKLGSLMGFYGLERVEVTERVAGDLFVVAGFPEVEIGDTLADAVNPVPPPVFFPHIGQDHLVPLAKGREKLGGNIARRTGQQYPSYSVCSHSVTHHKSVSERRSSSGGPIGVTGS